MKLISPLLRTIQHKNYYDLFSCWGGYIPAPKSLFRFAPIWIRGKDRDWGFFHCPVCGNPSFFQGECHRGTCWVDPCYNCDKNNAKDLNVCEECLWEQTTLEKIARFEKAFKKWFGFVGSYHKGER